MKPLVLVVTPLYPGPDNPNAGIFIHHQVRNLVREGLRVRVMTYGPAPPRFPLWLARPAWLRYFARRPFWPAIYEGVRSDHVFYHRRWEPQEDVVPAIGAALVRHVERSRELRQARIVYAHFHWTGGAAALSLRERFGLPVASIARGSEMHEWHETRSHCATHVKRVLREADLLLANCRDLRARGEHMVPGAGERTSIVYNGCDANAFSPPVDRAAAKRAVGFDERSRIALFCGSVEERKGIAALAAAWQEFAAHRPEWRLVVVGPMSDRSLVAALKAISSDRVILVGPVRSSRVVAYLQAADAYVQPSRLEGLSNATMEAMAVGVPVITTDVCGQAELIRHGENGWLLPGEDPQRLAAALEEVAADPQEAWHRGGNARETIVRDFDPRAQARRLAEMLLVAAAPNDASSVSGLPGGRASGLSHRSVARR